MGRNVDFIEQRVIPEEHKVARIATWFGVLGIAACAVLFSLGHPMLACFGLLVMLIWSLNSAVHLLASINLSLKQVQAEMMDQRDERQERQIQDVVD